MEKNKLSLFYLDQIPAPLLLLFYLPTDHRVFFYATRNLCVNVYQWANPSFV